MKRILLFLMLCIGMTSFAQTMWTGAGSDTNWSNTANWNNNIIPSASNDVTIPTGFTVTINVAASVKSITVQGNSTMNINTNLSFLNASSFAANVITNWSNGILTGGGTLTNNGTVKLKTNGSRYISGATTIVNNGVFIMPENGNLYLYDTAVFNNAVSGVFDINSDANINYSGSTHLFINAGLLKKSGGSGISYFYPNLTNTGTISVESGTIDLYYYGKNLDGGIYNVASGSTLLVSSTGMKLSGTLTGILDGALNWTGDFSVPTAAAFDFTGQTGLTWSSGSLIGGGTLTNKSKITLTTNGSRYISGGTTLANTGKVTMPSGGNLYLYDTAVFNNAVSGVFDINSDANINYSGSTHLFINAGLLKKSGGSGISYFYPNLTNTGTISVESGTIDLYYYGKNLDGGIYNVASGSTLLVSSTGMKLSGTLTGILDGPLKWTGNFSVANTAKFNFTGATGVNWSSGSLLGGGTLINSSTINLSTSGSRYISGTVTKLVNEGTINMPDGGNLYLYDDASIDNQSAGIIDFQSDAIINYSGSGGFNILNAGLIKKTAGAGISYIYSPVTNSGIIDASSGELEFVDGFGLTNTIAGIIKGSGFIDLPLPAKFTNDGTFAPGNSPGVLTVLGTYKSSASSKLSVELNGLTQGTQYDLLAITGSNAIFNGKVDVIMGFDGAIGNQFTIATTTGTIATANLTSPIGNVDYNGFRYTFDVSYPGNNKVMLSINNKVDILPPTVITKNITIQLDAAGNATITPSQINNGSTDNYTNQGNLVLSLDKTTFSCANLGANTVILTVTDEAGNFASASATVMVVDLIAPQIICPSNSTILSVGPYTLPDYFANSTVVASDNCSVTSKTQSPIAGTVLPEGVYTISFQVFDASANTKTCSFVLTVDDTSLSTVNNDLSEKTILIYPNPVVDILTIKNNSGEKLSSLEITDESGRMLNKIDLSTMDKVKNISFEKYISGSYYLKLNSAKGSVIKRIIKK